MPDVTASGVPIEEDGNFYMDKAFDLYVQLLAVCLKIAQLEELKESLVAQELLSFVFVCLFVSLKKLLNKYMNKYICFFVNGLLLCVVFNP